MCVGCRGRDQRSALLRVVLDPAAAQPRIVVDERACLPGRGAWIHPGAECLELAERRRAIPRALRADGSVDLAELQEHLGPGGPGRHDRARKRSAAPTNRRQESGSEADGHPMSPQR
ncbi:YlxR family protein [Myceligenerans indicum]|uniref:YlxR family protein n=1 Tax=Myceligenerans indicum TaxID=2593663 RepID=A0ABS1LJY6_9MICO|nr:YlxR family protein [Myceligenerans indicum]MBL0886493.1 YlxR family protein [Myceligenerans indicum]